MVIVDGNNVMGQRIGWHRDKPAAQQRLIEEVGRLSRHRNEPHILVFDAKMKSTVADDSNLPLFTVQYAGSGKSADELILELVYRYNSDSVVTVVTSDRALTRQVETLGSTTMRSGIFRKMLEEHA